MQLKRIELTGFKSFAKKTTLSFESAVTAIVGPNGSGKSNVVEAIRFVLGEQSMKSLRGKGGSDLIFKGSKALSSLSRANVAIVFDNKNRAFNISDGNANTINLDFDEIVISREVFSDGRNSYSINGSDVRLKDVLELVASVNIGSSGHHIISQGEADRLLSSSAKDRRGMIEDALGLRVYQYRIRDSERKLEKTGQNMKEVESLRREITPHINFLKKQVEKIEKARELREEVGVLYNTFFSRESAYINLRSEELAKLEETHRVELQNIVSLMKEKEEYSKSDTDTGGSELASLEGKRREVQLAKDDLSRKLGRTEGMIEALNASLLINQESHQEESLVSLSVVETLLFDIEKNEQTIETTSDVNTVRGLFKAALHSLREFVNTHKNKTKEDTKKTDTLAKISELENLMDVSKKEIERLVNSEREIDNTLVLLREKELKKGENRREAEREYYELKSKHAELLGRANILSLEKDALKKVETDFDDELREAGVLVGLQATRFEVVKLTFESIDVFRAEQEDLRRKIERIKIKLEDSGAIGGSDVLKEYDDTVARDQFLRRELDDLAKSSSELSSLITELKATLDVTFKEGIEKINTEFQKFFSLMFGGGSAFLSIVVLHKPKTKEDDEDGDALLDDEEGELHFERGIEINVTLPHKKVRDLHMLSGGERSLTSIALLFAMSQVNPPPFLVLDETDAALDEANSRKYGDMIETLSKSSELIVVTHNRETMSRAGVLYGVTIGADGGSRVLSIKLEEAVKIAK
jgi:chromosome segregation protein